MKTQQELDNSIRQVRGNHAVEDMLADGPVFQVYLLDDGSKLRVNKATGKAVRS